MRFVKTQIIFVAWKRKWNYFLTSRIYYLISFQCHGWQITLKILGFWEISPKRCHGNFVITYVKLWKFVPKLRSDLSAMILTLKLFILSNHGELFSSFWFCFSKTDGCNFTATVKYWFCSFFSVCRVLPFFFLFLYRCIISLHTRCNWMNFTKIKSPR